VNRNDLKIIPNLRIAAYDVAAVLIWLYTLSKLFVYDWDRSVLIGTFGFSEQLLYFRLPVVMFAMLLVSILLGRKAFLLFLLYIICFPIIILAWKVPFALVRVGSWAVGFAFANYILSTFSDLRYKLIVYPLYVASVTCIFSFSSISLIFSGVIGLTLAIIASYARAFAAAFRAPRMLLLYQKLFPFLSNRREFFCGSENQGVPLSLLTGTALTERVNHLQNALLANRATLYFSERLNDFNKSNFSVVSAIISSVSLITLSAAGFSIIYLGVHKMDPAAFSATSALSYFDYFNVSFDNMVFGSNNQIEMLSELSRGISILQRFLSLMIVALFLSVMIGVRQKKFEQEIEKTVDVLRKSAGNLEEFVKTEFKFHSVEEAIIELARIEAAFIKFISKLSTSLSHKPISPHGRIVVEGEGDNWGAHGAGKGR